MKFSLPKISSLLRNLKGLMIWVAFAVILFANSQPAFAFGGRSAGQPTQGTAQLDQVQRDSEAAIKGLPDDLEKVQSKANEGINEVQGAADADKMSTPENSKGAVSVQDQIENALESATGNK